MFSEKPFLVQMNESLTLTSKVIYGNDQHLKSRFKMKQDRLKSTKLHNPENSNSI